MSNLDSDYDRVLISLHYYIFGAGLTINSEEEGKIIKKSSELSINYITSLQQVIILFSSVFLSMIILLWSVIKDSLNLLLSVFDMFYKNSDINTPANNTKVLKDLFQNTNFGPAFQMIFMFLLVILMLLLFFILILKGIMDKYRKILIISEIAVTSTYYEYPIIIKPGIIYQKIQPYFRWFSG